MDQHELNEALNRAYKHSSRRDILNFGIYDRVSRAQAVSAEGLCANAEVLKQIIMFCPQAEIQHHQLKASVMQFQHLNDSHYKHDLWASMKAERLLTMLCHVRRIARGSDRFRQCLHKASEREKEIVRMILELCAFDDASST